MGKRKLAQKNTLAQWAGVEPKSTILIFKLDVAKFRSVCKPKLSAKTSTASTVADDDTTIKESISSDHQSENSSNSVDRSHPPAPTHPFFIRKTHEIPFANAARQSSIESSKSVRAAPNGEVHSFFKPRHISTKDAADERPVITKQSFAPLPPSRSSMHVTASSTVDAPMTSPVSVLGKRKRIDRASQASVIWHHAPLPDLCPGPREESGCQAHGRINRSTRPSNLFEHTSSHPAVLDLVSRAGRPLNGQVEQGSLWTARYRPRRAELVLCTGNEAKILRDWLVTRRLYMKDRLKFAVKKSSALQKFPDEYNDFIVDDDDPNAPQTSDIGIAFEQDQTSVSCPAGREMLWRSNLVIVSGGTGYGKSAAVQAVAQELDYEIFEVNAMDRRSSKDIFEHVGEASQSQMVNKTKAADGTQSKSLLLFEEVDVLYRDDKDFWTSVVTLASTSKRPVILTCNDTTMLPTQFDIPSLVLNMRKPDNAVLNDYLTAILANEDAYLTSHDIEILIAASRGDLRSAINNLQFLALSASGLQKSAGPTTLANELMSRQLSVSDVYASSKQAANEKQGKKRFSKYCAWTDTVGIVDVISSQQRSQALEQLETYENDSENLPARPDEKDDLIGTQIISEPYGRYTRLHPGDLDIAFCVAQALAETGIDNALHDFSIWKIENVQLDVVTAHQQAQKAQDKMWTTMMEACDPFAVPENWMQDYAPYNCIDRARLSGILPAQILPYLREMSRTEDEREDIERDALANHTGRTTRNTMSNEFGMAWRRPVKIPAALRNEILTTALH